MTAMVNHARINARICRKLLSASSFQQTPASTMAAMTDLNQQLESWRTTLPPTLRPETPINPADFHSTRSLNRMIHIRFSYYGSLTAIHTIFFFPWISVVCGIDPHNPAHSTQIAESTKVVAEAARNIIRATRYIQIDSASPQW